MFYPVLGVGGTKSFRPAIFLFCTPPLPVINDQSLNKLYISLPVHRNKGWSISYIRNDISSPDVSDIFRISRSPFICGNMNMNPHWVDWLFRPFYPPPPPPPPPRLPSKDRLLFSMAKS